MGFCARVFRLAMFLCVAGVFLTAAAGAVFASGLTADQAQRFVGAMPDVSALSQNMRDAGRDKMIEQAVRSVPGDGSFSPLLKGMPVMKERFRSEYDALTAVVVKHGFSSAEDWAGVGDRVMTAYMAIESPNTKHALAVMEQMKPAQIEAMTPDAREQFGHARLVMRALAAVPEAHQDIVRPLVPEIKADMQRAAVAAGVAP